MEVFLFRLEQVIHTLTTLQVPILLTILLHLLQGVYDTQWVLELAGVVLDECSNWFLRHSFLVHFVKASLVRHQSVEQDFVPL